MALPWCNQWFLINYFLFTKSVRTSPAGRLPQRKGHPFSLQWQGCSAAQQRTGQWEWPGQCATLDLESWEEHGQQAADDGLEKPVPVWCTSLGKMCLSISCCRVHSKCNGKEEHEHGFPIGQTSSLITLGDTDTRGQRERCFPGVYAKCLKPGWNKADKNDFGNQKCQWAWVYFLILYQMPDLPSTHFFVYTQ